MGTSTSLTVEGDYAFVGLRSNKSAMYIDKITIEWELPEGAVFVEAPEMTPETPFETSLDVTITSADAAHTIWYTTDGSEPTNAAPSIEYTAPFTINATTTVKAIATDGTNVSSVASATYTKREWLNGLSALVEKINEEKPSSGKEYYVNLTGVVVTGVNGNNAYLEEGEAGVLLYKYNHGLTVGEKYSGSAAVTAQMYKDLPELTSFDFTKIEEDVTLPLTTITIADLNGADFYKYAYRRVKIADAVVTKPLASSNATITQGENELVIYATGVSTLNEYAIVDVIGWPNLNGGTPQLRVLAQEDITEKGVAAVFSFSASEASARVGSPFVAPELENTYSDKNVTYTSSDETVATVNATTGEITILAEGETTIKASLAGGQNASYTLTVGPALANNEGYYYKVTSEEELIAGAKYLIAGVKDGATVVMSTNQKSNNRGLVSATTDGIVITNTGTVDTYEACEFVLTGTAGAWAFYDATNNSGYLYAAGSNKNNYLRTKNSLDDNGKATIVFDGAGNASIVFQGDNTNNCLRHNSNSSLFSCYSSGQQDVQLYKLYTENLGEFSIGVDGFASFYTDEAFVMPAGVDGGIITAAENGNLTIEYRYTSGSPVPAGTALLLRGEAGTYTYYPNNIEAAAPAGNYLHGADAVVNGKTFVEGTNVKYYVLSKDKDGNNLGFYWAEEDGAAITYQSGKAFLAIDFGSGTAPSMLKLFGGNTTDISGVESVKAENDDIYTLSGVCVGKDLKALPKGLYIKNGKKFIVE